MIEADMQCVAYTPHVPERDHHGRWIKPPSMSVRRFVGYPVSYKEIGCAFGYAVRDDHSPCPVDWRALMAAVDWAEIQASLARALPWHVPRDKE